MFAIILLIINASVIGIFAFSLEKKEVVNANSERALSIAQTAASALDSDRFLNAEIIAEIARTGNEQVKTADDIYKAINCVSDVVQQNSAAAEESAAASEEMNAQSNVLYGLVSQFKLKNDRHQLQSEHSVKDTSHSRQY